MGPQGALREIDLANSLGPYQSGKTRPIIVKFKTHRTRDIGYNNRRMLKGSEIFVHMQRRNNKLIDKIVTFAKPHDQNTKRVSRNRHPFT